MVHFRELKQIVEFEIIVIENREFAYGVPYPIDLIKDLALQILQASECHKDCLCNYKCECSKTNECSKCHPPKRFLRIKTSHGFSFRFLGPNTHTVTDEGICLEIQVSPKRIVSTKRIKT